MSVKKRCFLFISAFVFFLGSVFLYGNGNTAAAAEGDPLNLKGEAAILIDGKTGKVLYEKNADKLMGVASMSKMLTEYIVLESIKEGKISWDQEVTINEFVHKLSAAPGLSNIGLTEGEKYTVKELYDAMAIHSGNAATVALAELVAGSESNFVKLMNEKAKELGLDKYHFVNSTGLNNESMLGMHPEGTDAKDENKMSARSVAKLAYRLINDFPEVLETAKIPKLKFRDGKEYPNFNWMLPGLIYEYEGVDGLKTGSTEYAGYCFTATAERDGQRFISVIMKTRSQKERFEETEKLLNYAFSTFTTEELFPAGYTVKGKESLPVAKGKEKQVKIVAKEPLKLMIKSGEKDQYKPKLVLDKNKLNEKGELTAPVKKGEKVGYLTYEYEGEDYGFIDGSDAAKVDVVAADTVEKANWFVLFMRGVGSFFSDLWSSITSAVKGWF
ncbi:D-alanyl-D-alanine carboxypeptidase family protein [Caldibacillus debilis]|uniref:serine-type D-Ala-D-Ala carboxypeptidase n=1 Tax=Caldibacillus debilis TaxID=301148 RepID=A0A150M324_9BACI|nr:serine hydrolase [Caldibacillus debilis]KYD18835.1 D-alanyl-D-alanine carboxypeptidase [Caldibacillus debilis]